MGKRLYDIIIPVAAKDCDFLPRVVFYIRKYLTEAEFIYIITHERNFSRFKKLLKLDNLVRLLDENNVINELSYDHIKQYLANKKVYEGQGWYFQQFLKMGFAQTEYAKEYYLSWDADTLPLSHIQYFDDLGKPRFTMKREFHSAYFHTLKRLIGLEKIASFSFIAEHMMFNSAIMKELLDVINLNKDVEGENWIEKCINACEFDFEHREKGPYFSEFETYGTFVWSNYPNFYSVQILNTFRAAGFIRGRYINDHILSRLSLDLDIASFEIYDQPVFPYNIPFLWYKQKIRIIKLRDILLAGSPHEILKILKNKIKKRK